MPRPTIGERAMTDAERQARCRVARTQPGSSSRTPPPADQRSRARRWHDAVAELVALQALYASWLEVLPQNLHASPTAEALQAICDLDLADIQDIIPPRGFGRD